MIKFEPPARRIPIWNLPARLLRYFRGNENWREEFEAWDKAQRIELARTMAMTIKHPDHRAKLLEYIDQAEGRLRDHI